MFLWHNIYKMMDGNIWLYTSVRMVAIALVLIGGVNWFAVAFGYNLVESINRILSGVFRRRLSLDKVIYFIVGLCAIVLAFDRTLWLPFLGETVLPSVLIPVTSNNTSDNTVKVHVTPNTKVAYWSAKPGKESSLPTVIESPEGRPSSLPQVKDAYGNFENSGVVMSDAQGVATLTFDKGTAYVVPSGRQIDSHVHYRELSGEYGMIGPVQSVFV
jgi:uncharacterized membrane protein YuzA (DUF378 family)